MLMIKSYMALQDSDVMGSDAHAHAPANLRHTLFACMHTA